VNGTIRDSCQSLIVRHDDKGLPELVAQVEEQLVQFLFVLGVQRTGRLICQYHGRMVY
jgi:hypothetical protein